MVMMRYVHVNGVIFSQNNMDFAYFRDDNLWNSRDVVCIYIYKQHVAKLPITTPTVIVGHAGCVSDSRFKTSTVPY